MSEAHQGNSDESELFKSLKAHLNKRNRLQPFIGLNSIIECVNGGGPRKEAFYVCEVCVCRLDMADMRNHIVGSLHRYKYSKTKYPELVLSLGTVSCLSKLAWPLMDIAKKIEEKEGPGNVQVVEFDKTSYQQLASQRKNAKDAIDFLKNALKQSELRISESMSSKKWEESTSKRIIIYSPQKMPQNSSLDLENSPILTASDSLSESFVGGFSFLSNHTGPTPLVGLMKVIECQSEDGRTHCFLCHCCRVRALRHDIIDHLTSNSHLTNYLMETHPEMLEMVDFMDISPEDIVEEKFTKDEDAQNTKIQVVQVPEFLCNQMTTKSYHWCVKTIGWNNPHFPVHYIDVQRQRFSIFSKQTNSFVAFEDLQTPPKKMEKTAKKKTKKQNCPVFKVTLPISQGSLLIKRTSFIKDCPPSLALLPSENWTGQDQLNSPTDFPEPMDEYFKQEMDERFMSSFGDQCMDGESNSKDGLCDDISDASVAYNVPAAPSLQSEYVPPHGFLWPTGTKESEIYSTHPYYQCHQQEQPQYIAPDYSVQHHLFSSGHLQSGFGMIPQAPQPQNPISHDNGNTLIDYNQSFTGFYNEYGANSVYYDPYQVSSPDWGAQMPQPAFGQPLCYGPCCVPPSL